MGDRSAVEVPRGRRGRTRGGAGEVGALATQAWRTCATGPRDRACSARGCPPTRSCAPGRRGRRPRAPAARRRRRGGPWGDVHRLGVSRLGGWDHGRRLRGAGQHPGVRGDRHGPCPNVRGDGGEAARRPPARGASPRRRRRAATAAASSRRRSSWSARTAATWGGATCRRPARRRPSHADRGAPPPLRDARPPLRGDAPRGVARGGRTARAGSCESASTRSATRQRTAAPRRSTTGRAPRISKTA